MTLEKIPENLEKSDSEQFKQERLSKFIEYRHQDIELLPQQKLKPSDENYYRYKARGNAFAGIKIDIANLIDEGIITSAEATQKGQEYMEYVSNRDFSKFSTKEDVDKMNDILDIMIKELS